MNGCNEHFYDRQALLIHLTRRQHRLSAEEAEKKAEVVWPRQRGRKRAAANGKSNFAQNFDANS